MGAGIGPAKAELFRFGFSWAEEDGRADAVLLSYCCRAEHGAERERFLLKG